jgi:hypothetical protein
MYKMVEKSKNRNIAGAPMKAFSIDFYGGMLSAANDFRDTSANLKLTQPRLAFDKAGYDLNGFLNPAFRGPVEFDITQIFNIPLPITILGWEGAISSFGPIPPSITDTKKSLSDAANIYAGPAASGMHVDTWLSIGTPTGKMANDVFGLMKTGDTGAGRGNNMGLQLPVNDKLYLNYWAHNMRRPINPKGADDWHVGYVIYYQQ